VSESWGRIEPADELNQLLLDHVHPASWENPVPGGRYHLVVVGAGSAGLISAAIAASLGARVALVERHLLGGDCLNVGCVPSKALIHAARRAHATRGATDLGLVPPAEEPDFGAAMRRVREARTEIGAEDAAARYRDEFGVDVYLGDAKFTGRDRIRVAGTDLRFRRAVLATGGRPLLPPVRGLAECGALTNETVFTLTERPDRFGVVGGGPIGCELAQAFRRLGARVTLFEHSPQVLVREDPDAAALVQAGLVRDGIELVLGCQLQQVERSGETTLVHVKRADGVVEQQVFDALLVAAGRAPHVEDLGLEEAGVEFDLRRGARVDDRLRTTNPKIFAAGDVAWHPVPRMNWKFTHASDAMAKIVVQNALFFGRRKLSALAMPWCTYTDPEVAHVGRYEDDARADGVEVDTYTTPLSKLNRAVTEGHTEGFFRVHVKRGSDRILGATIVGPHAGDLIAQVSQAMVTRTGLGRLGDVIYPYPTYAEGLKATAGAFTRTRLTDRVRRLFRLWFRLFG
jgi:pyruvate/2-oxoglutarate dehydrogenase complex dihydrolipoamide dehydrogenase (E3) component